MALPQPGDPYVGSNGKLTKPQELPENDREFRVTASVAVPKAKDYFTKSNRSIKDLFVETQTQTVLNAILVYSLLGLTTNEIANILHVKPVEIDEVKELTAYQETFEAVFHELINANSQSLQARISSYAAKAVENVVTLAENKLAPAIVQLKASQDILDRSGLSAETLFNNGDNEGELLRIEIIDAADTKTEINIDIGKRK